MKFLLLIVLLSGCASVHKEQARPNRSVSSVGETVAVTDVDLSEKTDPDRSVVGDLPACSAQAEDSIDATQKYYADVSTFLKAYSEVDEEGGFGDYEREIYSNETLTLNLETKPFFSQQKDSCMVKVRLEGKQYYVASQFLKPVKDRVEAVQVSSTREFPSSDLVRAHKMDSSRGMSDKKGIRGIADKLVRPLASCYKNPKDWKQPRSYLHPGEDIAAPNGEGVRAIYNGVVVEITSNCRDNWGKSGSGKGRHCANDRGFGNRVMLMHQTSGEVWYSAYHHLARTLVRKGDEVEAGEKVGTVGSTGVSTGFHLHFEIMEGKPKGAYKRNDPHLYYETSKPYVAKYRSNPRAYSKRRLCDEFKPR